MDSWCVDLSAMKSRSRVVIRSLPKSGERSPPQRYQSKSRSFWGRFPRSPEDDLTDGFKECTTAEWFSIDLHREEFTTGVDRHASMEDRSTCRERDTSSPSPRGRACARRVSGLATNDRRRRSTQRLLILGEFVRIGRVQRGKIGIGQGIPDAVDFDGLSVEVDVMQESAVIHLPGGVAGNHLPFELELHDRSGLLHLGHQTVGPHPARLGHESRGRVVAVDGPGRSARAG